MASRTLETFEDGDVSEWTVDSNASFNANSNESYNGTYSGYSNFTETQYHVANRAFENTVLNLTLYYYEYSDSNGGAFELMSPGGLRVCGFGSANPQVMYTRGDGSAGQITAGFGYQEWIEVDVTLDYDTGDVTFVFTNMTTNESTTVNMSMENNLPVGRISVVNANNPTDLENRNQTSSTPTLRMRVDDISYQYSNTLDPIAELPINTGGNVEHIPVYDPNDNPSPHRVNTDSGVGTFGLTNPSEANFPEIRVNTQSDGVQAVTDLDYYGPQTYAENFQWLGNNEGIDSAWHSNWYVRNAGASTPRGDTTHIHDGPVSLQTEVGNQETFALDNQNMYDAVLGPGWGVQFWMWVEDDVIGPEFQFRIGDGFNSHYRLRLDLGQYATDLHLEKKIGGSVTTINSGHATIGSGEWVKFRFEWHEDGELHGSVNSSGNNAGVSGTANDLDEFSADWMELLWENGGAPQQYIWYDNFEFFRVL